MKLPAARAGGPLLIKECELDFTFHPMKKTNRRWGIHSMLYASDPWAVIAGIVSDKVSAGPERLAALSFVRQAREYFTAAEKATTIETRPLLYYYSFLNLGKAIAIAKGRPGMVGKIRHGVAPSDSPGHTLDSAELVIQSSTKSGVNKSAVDELHQALEGTPVAAGDYPVRHVIAQSVVAHRLWCEGFKNVRKERFLTIDRVGLFHDVESKQVWARLYIRRDRLRARGRGLTEALRESTLEHTFRAVVNPDPDAASKYHTLEQVTPATYTGRSADVVVEVVKVLRPAAWQTVTAFDPYRRFYLYLSPAGEKRLPQWLSVYMILFWLGSLTRYQPVELLNLLDGQLGPFFREFLETQPSQLLYILASEIKNQNVTRAGIV